MFTRAMLSWSTAAAFLISASEPLPALAGPDVAIVISADAPQLERAAAEELTSSLQQLFDAQVQTSPQVPSGDAALILLGSPQTNPAVADAAGGSWPELSQQGHVLKSVRHNNRRALIVGGGSPVATYWAAAELAHRFGMRSLLHGDYLPINATPFTTDGFDVVLEPTVNTRAWQILGDSLLGTQSWGLAEHQRLLRQLAKQKFNRVVIDVHAWQPFVHFAHAGTEKKTGVLFRGHRFPVSGDTPGRAAFDGAEFFNNPLFVEATSYEQRIDAGQRLMVGIIQAAESLGMDVALQLRPLEFPAEFSAVLPHAVTSSVSDSLSIVPGAQQNPRDPQLIALAVAQIRAYLQAYPQIDAVYLDLHHQMGWKDQADEQWSLLQKELKLEADTGLAWLTPPGDVSDGAAISRQAVALSFVHALLQQRGELVADKKSSPVQWGVAGLEPAFSKVLHLVLPDDTDACMSYGDSVIVLEHANEVQATEVSTQLVLPLTSGHAGVLPQLSMSRNEDLLSRMRTNQWTGFVAACEAYGDQAPTAYFLSRAAFDGALECRDAVDELVTTICGDGVSLRVALAFLHLQDATRLATSHVGAPAPDMVARQLEAAADPPEEWAKMLEAYTNAMNEMYRANTRARQGGRAFTLYYAKKNEFGLHMMTSWDAVRKAGMAAKGSDERAAYLEQAVEAMYSALNALSEVARDPSDRATIAVLNEFAFRPLVRELDAAQP